jgi:hypothetical protein
VPGVLLAVAVVVVVAVVCGYELPRPEEPYPGPTINKKHLFEK